MTSKHIHLDRFILGTNPLLGVDHLDRARARERAANLNLGKSLSVIEASLSAGANGLTFTASPRTYELLKAIRDKGLENELGLYPLFPDIQSYRNLISERGMSGMAMELLKGLNPMQKAKTIIQGSLSALTGDPVSAMKMYLDFEIRKLEKVSPTKAKLKVVFAHEIFTDMAISFKAKDLMKSFADHLREKVGVIPGFVTRNFVKFVQTWQQWGFSMGDIAVMTPINKLGFQMTPSREECEQILNKLQDGHVIAMSVLAAGRLDIIEAVQYIKSLHNLNSATIGVSTPNHAKETFIFLKSMMKEN